MVLRTFNFWGFCGPYRDFLYYSLLYSKKHIRGGRRHAIQVVLARNQLYANQQGMNLHKTRMKEQRT